MNHFLKIIRTLRKSSLEDIGIKMGLSNTDSDKLELAKEIEKRIISSNRKRKFTDSSLFKIGFPILMALMGFFLGKVTDISNKQIDSNLKNIDSVNQKNIIRISHPLPKELTVKEFSVRMDTSVFGRYLPDLRRLYARGLNVMKVYSPQDTLEYSKLPLNPSGFKDNFIDFFEGKDLDLTIVVGENLFEQNEELHKYDLIWNISSEILFKSKQHYLSYFVDHLDGDKEYLQIEYIGLENDNPLKRNDIKFRNGISSSLDLCNKQVDVEVRLDGNKNKQIISTQLSFGFVNFMDDNQKEFGIDFLNKTNYYRVSTLEWVRKSYPDYDPSNLQHHNEGVLNCQSL
nr:hypothetical protein [uncultured Allomuricauda sp.]